MKKAITYIICCIFVAGAFSCHKSDHENERGLAIALTILQQDAVKDVTLWVFDNQGTLHSEFFFATPSDIVSKLIDIPKGKYTIVGASNLKDSFTHNATIGKTRLEELLISINNASSSPAHSHYGVTTVDVADTEISYANLMIARSMAEMSLSIVNVPKEVVSARLEIINSAKGYFPWAGKLHSETALVDYGQIAPINGKLDFTTKRLMPTTALGNEVKTAMRLTLNYNSNLSLTINLSTPTMQNGGIYTPLIEYSILKPGMTIEVTTINGWVELPPINGEILNPNN